ncbi:hypothetical protein D7U87_08645 [Stenotrophomonas maltophilia]|nr:hypothetical protein B7H26_07060 [Stenotrophomonas maltophilia]MBA0255925.1 hypothetical protein [Stenotrophomonas maltophilia]MBA0340767.1 hypothetical protein [Stenotrophomonas maltophilia]MBA0378771.1 hypothetical protein [Stenotrophomonas maltophilia]MBA0407704.1 hypothetical protein [Stenotrophomonas maltophilia]
MRASAARHAAAATTTPAGTAPAQRSAGRHRPTIAARWVATAPATPARRCTRSPRCTTRSPRRQSRSAHPHGSAGRIPGTPPGC